MGRSKSHDKKIGPTALERAEVSRVRKQRKNAARRSARPTRSRQGE